MKDSEHLINHHGKYYVGTVWEYMSVCTSRFRSKYPLGLRPATAEDVAQHVKRWTDREDRHE